VVKCNEFNQLLQQHSKQTIRHLWQNLMGVMGFTELNMDEFEQWIAEPRQVRLC
jgi:hypothetical protein